jgi:GTPase SAR1 family protein
MSSWIEECQQNTDSPNVTVVLIGNKCDLASERSVSTEEGQLFAKEKNIDIFLETRFDDLFSTVLNHSVFHLLSSPLIF